MLIHPNVYKMLIHLPFSFVYMYAALILLNFITMVISHSSVIDLRLIVVFLYLLIRGLLFLEGIQAQDIIAPLSSANSQISIPYLPLICEALIQRKW